MPPSERIATFDNDGTLWSEQPRHFQLLVRLRSRESTRRRSTPNGRPASRSPRSSEATWPAWPPGEKGVLAIVAATHTGMTTDEFRRSREGLDRHGEASDDRPAATPRWSTSRCWKLLAYLRANGFKTFIVSGGGVEFMRAVDRTSLRHSARAGRGSSGKLKLEVREWQAGADQAARD